MFRIIGADGREYGPIPAETLGEWVRQGRASGDTQVQGEGWTDWRPLRTVPELAPGLAAPPPLPAHAPPPGRPTTGDGVNKIIPYRNVPALAGYYCAVFSLIPILGLVPGLIGFALGIVGLRKANREPAAGGKVHAWIGIILGGLCGFGYLALVIFMIVAGFSG